MAKGKLTLKLICSVKNENTAGGNALLALDPKPTNEPGKQQTRKTVNMQTTDVSDLDIFKPGKNYQVTIEEL